MKKYLKIIVPILIAVGLIIALVTWLGAPEQGKISQPTVRNGASIDYSDKKLDGKYISFQYSGKYVIGSDVAKNDELEFYTLKATTQYDKRIQASVAPLQGGRLDTNSAYTFRKASPHLYLTRKAQIAGAMTDIWVKRDGKEQTAMIPKGDKVAVLSFVTSNAEDDFTEEVDKLLNTFVWK